MFGDLSYTISKTENNEMFIYIIRGETVVYFRVCKMLTALVSDA